MISEAAITGKPIYVCYMNTIRNNSRFRNFFNKFENMKIIKDLNLYQSGVDSWTYDELDELKRITPEINERMKKMELFKALKTRSRSHKIPFKHWEIDKPLTPKH